MTNPRATEALFRAIRVRAVNHISIKEEHVPRFHIGKNGLASFGNGHMVERITQVMVGLIRANQLGLVAIGNDHQPTVFVVTIITRDSRRAVQVPSWIKR